MLKDPEFIDLKKHRHEDLYGRYIHLGHIGSLIDALPINFHVEVIGRTVRNRDIPCIKFGKGEIKVLMWSQMHGNESTTTKALFDLFSYLESKGEQLMDKLSLCVIPILNPDGAYAYTRTNANSVDLNRDAQDLSQPESQALHRVFDDFKPDYCFNLHGQRTIFSAGEKANPATLSFLAPAVDDKKSIPPNRENAMKIIAFINNALQPLIPHSIGIYDDSFNLNCVGDTFQNAGSSTILFEAGHYSNDYQREHVRNFMSYAIFSALKAIAYNSFDKYEISDYEKIPLNMKLFRDIILRKGMINGEDSVVDIAIQYEERLKDQSIEFQPQINAIGKDLNFFGHKEIEVHGKQIKSSNSKLISIDHEIDVVLINDELLSLKVDKI